MSQIRKLLVTRNEVRLMGLDVSNTQFGRWEEEGFLIPFKAGNHRSAIVRYRVKEVLRFIVSHSKRRDRPQQD